MKNSKGISLPEILLGTVIAAVLGGILVNLLISTNALFFDQSIKLKQGLSLNQASKEITTLIKSSAGISSQYPPAGTADYTTNANTLVLKLPSVNQSGEVIEQVFDYAVLSKDPGSPKILRKKIFVDQVSYRNAEDKVLSTVLEDLTFVYLDSSNLSVSPAEAVRINFTIDLSENSNASENKSSSSGTANLKN